MITPNYSVKDVRLEDTDKVTILQALSSTDQTVLLVKATKGGHTATFILTIDKKDKIGEVDISKKFKPFETEFKNLK
jgi:hypothetical protein